MNNVHVGRTLAVLLLGAFISILNQTLINNALPHLITAFNISATTAQWLSTAYMLVNGVNFLLWYINASCYEHFSSRIPAGKKRRRFRIDGDCNDFCTCCRSYLSRLDCGELFLAAASWLKDVIKPTYPKFDAVGAITSTVGFGGLLYGFSEASDKGWASAEVISFLLLGAIFIAVFVWRELSVEQPLLEMRVFKYNIFTLTTIIGAAINLTMFGGMILLPIYLQSISGFTPLQAGLLLLPGAVLMGIMSPISGALFDRIGACPLAIIGLIITTITTYEFSKLTSSTTYGHNLMLYTIRMFGMSFMMMTVQTAGLNQVPLRLGAQLFRTGC